MWMSPEIVQTSETVKWSKDLGRSFSFRHETTTDICVDLKIRNNGVLLYIYKYNGRQILESRYNVSSMPKYFTQCWQKSQEVAKDIPIL
jgi:hypothetical protein